MIHGDLEAQDRALRLEADDLLARGVLTILHEYGMPHVSGSYALQLMTWRDLDIYLEMRPPDLAAFFDMARALGRTFLPRKLSVTDQLNFSSTEPLSGLYLGMQTQPLESGGWKVDVWGVTPEVCAERLGVVDALRAELTPAMRRAALEIKHAVCHTPAYRKTITSQHVYDAVLDGVTTTAEFMQRVSRRR